MSGKRLALTGAGLVAVAVLVVAAALGAFASSGSSTAAGARADAVHVHGHWTIVVRSKSGKVVSRHSFHNDFMHGGVFSGDGALSQILAGNNAPGDWDLSISGSACPASNANFCQMFEPGSSAVFFASPPDEKNLVVTVPTTGPDAYKIVLSGHVTATNDGTIGRVGTGLQVCPASSTVGGDCSTGYNAITDRSLATPVSVSAGQDISVTVKLSFS